MNTLTTMSLLAKACKTWNGSVAFADVVAAYLKLSGSDQRVLADEFEAAISTVSRWANGVAQPRPRMQKLIVAWIGRRAAKAAEGAEFRGSSSGPMNARLPMAAKG